MSRNHVNFIFSFGFACLLLSSLSADLILNDGKLRTDNSSSTNIIFDPDEDNTAEAILDSGGNLGLGTLTPSANIDVVGDVYVSGELIVGGNVLNSDGSLQDGLVGWWSFDDGSGTSLTDHAGSGNGTLTGGALWADGKFGKGVDFDGTDDYIDMGTITTDFSNGMSVSAWVYYDNFNSWSRIIDFSQGSANDNIVFANNGASNNLTVQVYINGTGGAMVTATGALVTGSWLHLAYTLDEAGNCVIYKNGVSIQTGTTSVPANVSRNISYIAKSAFGDPYFDGKIDEVRVYNRALSQKEIVALYTHGQAKLAAGGTISDNVIISGNLGISDTVHFSSISEPSSPNTGQVYSNGSNLQFYNGTEWLNLTAAGNTAWTQPGSGNLLYSNGSVTMGSITNQQGTLIVGNGGSSDNILTLDDNGSSVLTVADGGSVGIGTTSPSQKLDVVGDAGFGATTVGGNITITDNVMPSANVTYDIGTNAASLNATYAVDYYLMSDKRLKAGIKETQSALERVSQLRPVQFHFKNNPKQTRLGLIAQEVEHIVPEAVKTDGGKDGIKGLSYHELTVLVLAAQKEEMTEIDDTFIELNEQLKRIKEKRKRLLKKLKAKKAGGQK